MTNHKVVALKQAIGRPLRVWTAGFLYAIMALSVAVRAATPDDRSVVLEEFDVAPGGDLITVPVSIMDKRYDFILDTGFTCSCVSERHRRLLGRPLRTVPGAVPGGGHHMERFRSPAMRLGRLPLQSDPEIGCVDLSSFEPYLGRQVDGILGMDALSHVVLNIDFDHGKVRVLKSAHNSIGQRVPITWHRRKHMREGPFIEAIIDDDLPCEFLIDTGAARAHFGTLECERFDFLQSEGVIHRLRGEFSALSIRGNVATRFGQLRKLSIAGCEHQNVLLERLDFWNTLGLGFLSRYVATFDFPASTAYLAPGRSFGAPEPINRSGLSIDRRGEDVVVTRVAKRSPGALSGIEPGDVLVSVNGQPVKSWSLYRIRNLVCVNGTIAATIRHGNADVHVEILLPGQEPGPAHTKSLAP